MAEITSLHGCDTCGNPSVPVDLMYEDRAVMTVKVCQACRDKGNAFIQQLKPARAAMVAAGIDEDIINATMMFAFARYLESLRRSHETVQ